MISKMLHCRKGQAMTEYIHTYGWIILMAIALGGAMIYFNVGGTKDLIPVECYFMAGIGCLDVGVQDDLLTIVVVNEFSFALGNVSVSVAGTCNSIANTTDGNYYGNLNVLVENKQANYVFECQNLAGLKLFEVVTLEFVNVESGQSHTKVGRLEYAPEV
ncbi:hypothetical protein HQ545_05420 [Candidatus Woesearchaeota archaeon]|nr:hypothetical protein [Candidatus Woesearchaeota archaeon]